MRTGALLLAALAALSTCVDAVFPSVPLPKRSAQLNLGEDHAPILIEAHMDLLCPDCAEAWVTLKDLAESYGPEKLQLGVRLYPLPHHRNGFLAAQAAQAVRAANESAVFKFIDLVFDAQSHFWDAQRAINDVSEEFTQLAEGAGASRDSYLAKMATQSVELAARAEWRLGASRGVSSTPTFFVNGALLGADEDWSVELWRSVLDPLLVGEGESHGTQHWSVGEWKAVLGPLLENHKRKSDPLLSAVAARKEAVRTGEKASPGELVAAKATAELAAKAEATLKDAPKVEAVKPQTQAQEQAAPAKQQQDGAETKPSASRLDELKRQVTGGASAGRSGASPSASAAAGKSLVETIEAGLEQGIEAAEAAVAGAASVLTGGALGASGSGAPREGDGGGGSSLSAEQAAKVKEMKARLGLVSQSRHHSRKAGA